MTNKAKPDSLRCKFCLRVHSRSQMCATGRRVLDALIERGMDFNMPTLEFPEPIHDGGFGGPGDALVLQLVVKAAVVPVGDDTYVGALVFTGQDHTGRTLPQWIMPADDDQLDRTVKLMADMADMAKRRAAQAREGHP